MQIIALITDRPKNDFYSSAVKGRLLSAVADAQFFEISERMPMHQVETAAFMLKYLYMNFPENTIFIIGIKSLTTTQL